MRKHASMVLALLVAAICSGPLFAQANPGSPGSANKDNLKGLREATQSSPWLWDVQTVIDQYVKVMSGYYGLTEKQEQYTKELMNQRVKRFLKDYEKDVRTLMGEYQEYRMKGEAPSPEAAKEFAKRAQPLITAIRQEILDGNKQWRTILNEEQLKKHDRDLELMNQQFDLYEQSMDRWAKGEVRPSDLGIRQPRGPMNITKVEDSMGLYVRNFIAQYGLDEGQRQTAYSILREAREEVGRYRESHKAEFAELDAKQKELTASNPIGEDEVKRAKEEGRKLTERRAELEKPLNEDLFARFKDRLETIPTSNQRTAYADRQNALKERLSKLRKQVVSTTLPATTQPATTQPAGEAATDQAQ